MPILIIAKNKDVTTDLVIDWISFYGKKVIRMDFEEFISTFNLLKKILPNGSHITKIIDKTKNISIKTAWFRMDTRNDFHFDKKDSIEITDQNEIYKYLKKEIITSKQLFFNEKKIKWLSQYKTVNLNKFEVLGIAKTVGLEVPETIITNNKIDIIEFFKENKFEKIIYKSIAENLNLIIKNKKVLYQPVGVLNIQEINNLPDRFMPTLFQRLIIKEVDIRIFYLNGKCYSMSIHSQNVDYRESYENAFYNPIQLPIMIKEKIIKLMNKLKLEIGSLDFVLESYSNKFIFLEINPNGHFGMVSEPCNYYLEREVAKFLCNEN